MLSIQACREILSAAGSADLSDDEVARLRDVLTVVTRLQLRQQFGIGQRARQSLPCADIRSEAASAPVTTGEVVRTPTEAPRRK